MQKLVSIITSAIAFIFGLKETNAKLKAELDASNATIAAQAKTIEDLQDQVENDKVDDAALESAAADARSAATAAEERATALKAEIDAADAEAEKLAAAITANPETPNVDANFKVIG